MVIHLPQLRKRPIAYSGCRVRLDGLHGIIHRNMLLDLCHFLHTEPALDLLEDVTVSSSAEWQRWSTNAPLYDLWRSRYSVPCIYARHDVFRLQLRHLGSEDEKLASSPGAMQGQFPQCCRATGVATSLYYA